jgi:hypothetical protein
VAFAGLFITNLVHFILRPLRKTDRFRFKETNMKRIALLSLLAVPSVVNAHQTDVHSAPYAPSAAVGTSVDQGYSQYNQRPIAQQFDADFTTGCPTSCRPICADSSGWFGDIGFYILRPQWSGGNPAFAYDAFTAGTTDRLFSGQVDFDHDYSFAPLVQIGYAGRNGLGVRGRWWTLRSTETLAGGFAADPTMDIAFRSPSLLGLGGEAQAGADIFGAGVSGDVSGDFRNRLDLDVIDIEGIWSTNVGRSSVLSSAGVRYAHIGQTYDANFSQTSSDPLNDVGTSLRATNAFSGAGPTVSLQGYRMIGETNLSIYGLSRGSLLFGESRQRAFRSDSLGNDISASLTSESVRPVMELEVGTNWSRSMGNYDLFMENGLVGMVWFNTGNAANSDSILAGNVGADNANQDLGLLGLRFSTGIRF